MTDSNDNIIVHKSKFFCDGNIGNDESPSDGHPRVYLQINPETNRVTCPYCDKTFVLAPKDSAASEDAA